MVTIRLERLSKWYGTVEAVRDLTLEVPSGELLALLGPSGCGKTSTLKMIAGVEKPSGGEISFNDRSVTGLPPGARNIAMVFEDYALYPRMSAGENIAFPLRIRHIGRAEIARRVGQVAEMLHVENLLDKGVDGLAGGQQQRIAIGRALVRKPDVLLLDEPLSHLDAELKVEFRAELKRLQKDAGVTTILVTHDQVEAMAMADRVAVMDAGRLHQVGTPEALYHRPATVFVASFIGEPPMNLLPGILTDGATPTLGLGSHRLPLPRALLGRLEAAGADRAVLFGIRPEAVGIARDGREGWLPGEVFFREGRGDEEVVLVRLGDLLLHVETDADFGAKLDEPVCCRLDLTVGHFFDPKSGRNLLFT
jgi:ABC-type sugar transport system ATPase subunit